MYKPRNEMEIIKEAIASLSEKFKELAIKDLSISEYNKVYLGKYKKNFSLYMALYQQLLDMAIRKLQKPVNESIFVDYGGGCGILSYLATELGFKKVIYVDLYDVSIEDTRLISNALNLPIDHYINGDISDLVTFVRASSIKIDLICSFDVLEHIYNLEKWFSELSKLNGPYIAFFMTAANPRNPFIRYRLKKLHRRVEFYDQEIHTGWKPIDVYTSFLKEREKIITAYAKNISKEQIVLLSERTRGLRKEDILYVVDEYLKSGKIIFEMDHPTNTCDPYTGNWAERLIDLKKLKKLGESRNFVISFSNSKYGFSHNKWLTIPKVLLNLFINLVGSNNLFLSPTYTLQIEKQD